MPVPVRDMLHINGALCACRMGYHHSLGNISYRITQLVHGPTGCYSHVGFPRLVLDSWYYGTTLPKTAHALPTPMTRPICPITG